jgi:hypothetical protein
MNGKLTMTTGSQLASRLNCTAAIVARNGVLCGGIALLFAIIVVWALASSGVLQRLHSDNELGYAVAAGVPAWSFASGLMACLTAGFAPEGKVVLRVFFGFALAASGLLLLLAGGVLLWLA